MYRCFSDINGNMPCDNGCLCDKCLYEDVDIVVFTDYWGTLDDEQDEDEYVGKEY